MRRRLRSRRKRTRRRNGRTIFHFLLGGTAEAARPVGLGCWVAPVFSTEQYSYSENRIFDPNNSVLKIRIFDRIFEFGFEVFHFLVRMKK